MDNTMKPDPNAPAPLTSAIVPRQLEPMSEYEALVLSWSIRLGLAQAGIILGGVDALARLVDTQRDLERLCATRPDVLDSLQGKIARFLRLYRRPRADDRDN